MTRCIASALIALPIACAVAFGSAGVAQAATTASASRVGADKATQVSMSITNDTAETLNLTSATSSGTGNHWQQRPTTLAPGGYEMVTNYAAGDAEISLTYTSADTGTVYTLHAETPLVGHNSSSGSSSNSSYTVNNTTAGGYDPTDIFSMDPGHTFTYSGQAQTYTVPAGVRHLDLEAVGGSGGSGTGGYGEPSGAEVSGTLDVTPGEVLTVGVGGMGGSSYIEKAGDNGWTHTYDGTPSGGWGLANGTTSYAGGNGIKTNGSGSAIGGLGGGGASVILDGNGDPLVVAGGGGGMSIGSVGQGVGCGGQGGYQGQLTGGSGTPNGGAGGANTVSQGQASPSTGGGAGGGGVRGGLAGSAIGAGGGAGSSFYSSQLVGGTVRVAPNDNSNAGANSQIVISGITGI